MVKVIVLCLPVLIAILVSSTQVYSEEKNIEVTRKEVLDLVTCMKEDTCTEKITINNNLGKFRSGRVLRHEENGNRYIYVFTEKETLMVMIHTPEGNFLLDDVFLIGVVTSGFFIPHGDKPTRKYPEKKKNEKGEVEIVPIDNVFFQNPYTQAVAIAVKRFVNKKQIRKSKKPEEI